MAKEATEVVVDIQKYSKKQILESKKFMDYNKDVMSVILADIDFCTIEDVEAKYNEFMERTVK